MAHHHGTCIPLDEVLEGPELRLEDQLPLAPVAQVVQQGAGQQAGQGLGFGALAQAAHRLAAGSGAVDQDIDVTYKRRRTEALED